MRSLDHSILIIAKTLRIINIDTSIEFLTVVLERDSENQLDRCVKIKFHIVNEEIYIHLFIYLFIRSKNEY
jgi:hypothetical protein